MKRKTLGDVELLDSDRGVIKAVFSTLNVRDHDGDITPPGAFKEGSEVKISAYNHGSHMGALPVGKGTIHSDSTKAWLDGQFFMNTTGGKDTFETVKQLGTLGEWSYGYDVLKEGPGEVDGVKGNILHELAVYEVSPVLLGAGIGTHTIEAKNLTDMDDDELAKEAERAFKALHERGIMIPETVAQAVRVFDATVAEAKRRKGELALYVALFGNEQGVTA